MHEKDKDRIKSQIETYCLTNDNGCWIWTRSYRGKGYAQITLSGRRQTTGNRAAYFAYVGSIPDGMIVCHKCDTPICCNPAHLFLGTHKDNSQDCVSKGRLRPGRVGGPRKIADHQRMQIVEMSKAGALQKEIAEVFGVTRERISQIIRGKYVNH